MQNSMNNRANIMYFIEHLCDLAQREQHPEYIRMIQRDILRIIDAVCPSDGSGAANIRVVRRVLAALQQKNVLMPETVSELDVVLKEREGEAHAFLSGGGDEGDGGVVSKRSAGARLEKRQIEQRIEEDRERHKRLREGIWAVDHGADGDGELDKLWDEASDIGEDDYLTAKEDAEERRKAIALG
jgi:CTD kinase subunit gamma